MTTTRKRSGPPLRELLATLKAQAAQFGDDRALALSHGARVAWRVKDGRVTFAVSRKEKPVGDTEIITFKAQAGVPAEAVRIPSEGQQELELDGHTWHRVGWRWAV